MEPVNDKNVRETGLKNPGLLWPIYLANDFKRQNRENNVLLARKQSQTNPQGCRTRSFYFRKGRKDRARESPFETSIRVKIDHNSTPWLLCLVFPIGGGQTMGLSLPRKILKRFL